MTRRSPLSIVVRTVLFILAVEVAAGIALTLRPDRCRSTDAVAVYRVPPDACVEAKRIGAAPCR